MSLFELCDSAVCGAGGDGGSFLLADFKNNRLFEAVMIFYSPYSYTATTTYAYMFALKLIAHPHVVRCIMQDN